MSNEHYTDEGYARRLTVAFVDNQREDLVIEADSFAVYREPNGSLTIKAFDAEQDGERIAHLILPPSEWLYILDIELATDDDEEGDED